MPLRCRECGREIPASQAMDTLDPDTFREFRERFQALTGGIPNIELLNRDPWYVERAARQANGRAVPCPGCGASGRWEGRTGFEED